MTAGTLPSLETVGHPGDWSRPETLDALSLAPRLLAPCGHHSSLFCEPLPSAFSAHQPCSPGCSFPSSSGLSCPLGGICLILQGSVTLCPSRVSHVLISTPVMLQHQIPCVSLHMCGDVYTRKRTTAVTGGAPPSHMPRAINMARMVSFYSHDSMCVGAVSLLRGTKVGVRGDGEVMQLQFLLYSWKILELWDLSISMV